MNSEIDLNFGKIPEEKKVVELAGYRIILAKRGGGE